MTGEPLPRYVQISEKLIRDIAAGRIADGARLAPERQLAKEFGVAVGTLRKALDHLAGNGLLRRVQGSGNYVNSKASAPSVYAHFRLEGVQGGGLPTAEILSLKRTQKPDKIKTTGPSDEGFRIRRLRRLDGDPVAIEEIWLDGSCAKALGPGEISESLYHFYRQSLGLEITNVEDRVGLGVVPQWANAPFDPDPGEVAPMVERCSMVETGEIVEVSFTWFDNHKSRYVSRL